MRRKRRVFFILLWLLGLLPLVGVLLDCSPPLREAPAFHYYILSYGSQDITKVQGKDADIKIEEFHTVEPYDTDKMIYFASPFELHPSVYHRWVARPGEMLEGLFLKYLQRVGLFREVYPSTSANRADYSLFGDVEEFACISYIAKPKVVLRVAFVLKKAAPDNLGAKVVLNRIYVRKLECADTRPYSFASSMSVAVKSIFQSLVTDINEALKKEGNS